ncbi:unnamed protein product [Brassica oleracea]|uniref:(rape) hypothetical protein n=1 Tax=Brassica napus TaxID=3708 RepID=A0A816QEQ9_BRANA|nr:unnamed protein product [Brassica napus]
MKISGRIDGDKKKEHISSSNETGMESDVGSCRVPVTLYATSLILLFWFSFWANKNVS